VDSARNPRSRSGSALRSRPRAIRTRRWSWLRPPRILRPTRAGWCFFALTFGVGFAALNTGNNLLYLVLSLMLSFLVLSGLLSEAALRGLAIDRVLPRETFAGADNRVLLNIHNRQTRVTSLAIVVEDHLEQNGEWRPAGRCFALRIAPGETETRSYALQPARRGWLLLAGLRVSTRFPFGLFLKSMIVESPGRVLVYPEIETLRTPVRPSGTCRTGEVKSHQRGPGAEVSGLREHQKGDSARRIHWRSSLRRGALLVGEVDAEQDAEIEVLLRTLAERPGGSEERGARHANASQAKDPAFEERVRWAASEVICQLEAGLRVALRTDHAFIRAGSGAAQRARLLGFLALVRVSSEPAQRGLTADPQPSERAS
jgi:uncharacterized protein (DUF58 family)